MKLAFLGDIHGNFSVIKEMLLQAEAKGCDALIQVGDFGIFNQKDVNITNKIKAEHPILHFFKGNHDNPELCNETKGYLGDFGFNSEFGVFYIGGALSIDIWRRHIGLDYWDNEELSWGQWNKCLELYNTVRPEIVISHDAPNSIARILHSSHSEDGSFTQKGLEALLDLNPPKIWLHGHHHISKTTNTKSTKFVSLGIDEFKVIDTDKI